MKNYIICSIMIFLIILYLAHYIQLTKKNNELRILQTYDPDENTQYELFKQKLPIILIDEVFLWNLDDNDNNNDNNDNNNDNNDNNNDNDNNDDNYAIDKNSILDKSLSELRPILLNKTIHNRIIQNLNHYSLALSRGWLLSLETIKNTPSSNIIPKKENNYMHIIACLTGEIRIILFPPNINKHIIEDNNLTNNLLDSTLEIPCLEIIIRIGNMIYIPYGWWMFLYSYEKTIILDAINSSIFGII